MAALVITIGGITSQTLPRITAPHPTAAKVPSRLTATPVLDRDRFIREAVAETAFVAASPGGLAAGAVV
jgi:hypothetical protein